MEFNTKNLDAKSAEHEHTSIPENLEKFLFYLRLKTRRAGDQVILDYVRDYTVIDSLGENEFRFIVDYAEKQQYIERSGMHCWLTAGGWAHLMGPSGGGAIPGRCFVAMSFSVEPAMYDAIRGAILACGYSPISMKDVLFNEDICHEMLAEIRKAEIVVADFTELKSGVYFEAGFARALGREVFWTCRNDFITQVHFDTNHYQHIVWTSYEDLRQQLLAKILAVVGPGPNGLSGDAVGRPEGKG